VLRRELTALYDREGTSMFAGCLPALLQWPVLAVVYLLFRSRRIGSAPNVLLAHHLCGAPLGSYWLSGAGPFSAQGAVFAALFLVLIGSGWVTARMLRAGNQATGAASAGTARLSGAPAANARGPGSALARLAPFTTVAVAACVPLAAGLYLVATSAWTLAERAVLRRTGRRR
jgi:YidC/Oxa1 family membrane protein insertase